MSYTILGSFAFVFCALGITMLIDGYSHHRANKRFDAACFEGPVCLEPDPIWYIDSRTGKMYTAWYRCDSKLYMFVGDDNKPKVYDGHEFMHYMTQKLW